MPSTSVAQQKLMGMAYALKKGELDPKDASAEVQELAEYIPTYPFIPLVPIY